MKWIKNLTSFAVFLMFLGLGYYIYLNYFEGDDWNDVKKKIDDVIDTTDSLIQQNEDSLDVISEMENYFPVSEKDMIIKHRFYTLSYSEKDEQAKWVAYELSKDKVNSYIAERTNDFREDPLVSSGSATLDDYRGSGYDRGHLCPAGDMAFSRLAMSESFFMSNMSPQDKSFNRGVWKELEDQTRDWVRANQHLYIVTGPVLGKRESNKIGESRVSVPKAYYKAILDLREPEQKAIAFLIPNKKQTDRLEDFAMSIDELEMITSIDFFPSLPDRQERELESNFNPYRWAYDEERYKLRLTKWNKY